MDFSAASEAPNMGKELKIHGVIASAKHRCASHGRVPREPKPGKLSVDEGRCCSAMVRTR